MADHTNVMISSTIRDLPKHRDLVMHACLQQEMFPHMMEHLPAKDVDAINISMGLVDKANIYLGVFGYRYGYIPAGYDISITEMEYDRAKKLNITRMIFIVDQSHLITIDDVDFEGRAKLLALKDRLLAENTVNFFRSPENLQALVLNSLSEYRYTQKLKNIEGLMKWAQKHQQSGDISDTAMVGFNEVIGSNNAPFIEDETKKDR